MATVSLPRVVFRSSIADVVPALDGPDRSFVLVGVVIFHYY